MAAKLVKDIMTKDVVRAIPATPVAKIAKMMVEGDLTGLPVVRKNTVVGIVTDSDLVSQKSNIHSPRFLSALHGFIMLRSSESVEQEIKKLLGSRAEDIMTSPVVSVRSKDTIARLATRMVETKANPIPVIDDGALVGIVSRHDLLKLISEEQDQQDQAEQAGKEKAVPEKEKGEQTGQAPSEKPKAV